MSFLGIDQNIWGLIISYIFVFAMIGLSTLLQNKKIVNEEGARKLIHIGVSNWYLIAMLFFDNVWFAIIPPVTFIILNYISYKQNVFKAMERNGQGNLGTVYFPISLLIVTYVSFNNTLGFQDPTYMQYFGALAILILGYGDGFAAVFGKAFGSKKLYQDKSFVGTLVMFGFSFLVSVTLLLVFANITSVVNVAFVLAIFASVIELFSPRGLDNLTVPLGVFVIYYAIYLGVFA